jgi:hypothetical protein
MSQAGGPNTVASVDIAFTGSTANLDQAAAKAEQRVKEAAATMQATVSAANVAATAGSVGSIGGAAGGPIGSAAAGGSAVVGRFRMIGDAAKSLLRPVMSIIGAFSQLTLILGIVVAAGTAVYNIFRTTTTQTEDMSKAVKELGENLGKAFNRFDYVGDSPEEAARKELEALAEVYKEKSKEVAALREKVLGPVGENYIEPIESIKKRFKQAKELEDRLASEYGEAQAGIEARLQDKLQDIRDKAAKEKADREDKARKEREDKERESAKRVEDFWRDVRGNQVSGFAVEGFQTSNLSQSLDLLARQRGGVDGPKQLRVDYGGTR